jgi:hypothetical protein
MKKPGGEARLFVQVLLTIIKKADHSAAAAGPLSPPVSSLGFSARGLRGARSFLGASAAGSGAGAGAGVGAAAAGAAAGAAAFGSSAFGVSRAG